MNCRNYSNSDLLVQVAQLYYMENRSQAEIAEIIHVSRPQVSKLLMKAREVGIVTITVTPPSDRFRNYEAMLCHLYGIESCIVIPEGNIPMETEEAIIEQAVKHVQKLCAGCSTVGIGWGSMLNGICNHADVIEDVNPRAHVVPLIGSLNSQIIGYNTNELARKMGLMLGFTPNYLYAPAFPQTKNDQIQFRETGNYRDIASYWAKLDAAVFRIKPYPCVPDLATAFRYGKALYNNHAVGVILSNFFNVDGKTISGEYDYSISIPDDQLLRCPIRLGICANTTMPESVIGALRSGMVTHLILSERLAKDVLKLSGAAPF